MTVTTRRERQRRLAAEALRLHGAVSPPQERLKPSYACPTTSEMTHGNDRRPTLCNGVAAGRGSRGLEVDGDEDAHAHHGQGGPLRLLDQVVDGLVDDGGSFGHELADRALPV